MIECIDLLHLKIFYSPGEARTHNPGIALQCTVYKYRALTDCATGERLFQGHLSYHHV